MPRIVRIPVNVFAIVNPFSGAGMDPAVSERRVELLRAELKRRSIEGAVQLTRHPGHARELAASAASAHVPLVIVWGGDGTVNEAGSALVGTRSALALIPAGSGNGLAAALAVPRDPEAAIATAIDAEPRPIDVGFVNDRAFFNVAGIGFDAHIARLFNLRSRGARGRWPYISIGVREGCRYRGLDYDLDLEGEHFHLRSLLIAFANGPEYGMGARIAPEARLDDGLLDACVAADRSVLARFWHVRHLAFGSIARAPEVILRKVRTATVASAGPLEYHVDGEWGRAEGKLEVRIAPGALLVKGQRIREKG